VFCKKGLHLYMTFRSPVGSDQRLNVHHLRAREGLVGPMSV